MWHLHVAWGEYQSVPPTRCSERAANDPVLWLYADRSLRTAEVVRGGDLMVTSNHCLISQARDQMSELAVPVVPSRITVTTTVVISR